MTTTNSVSGAVDRFTDSKAFQNVARAGYLTSGVLHLLLAYIVVRLAIGGGGSADQSGALATLAGNPGGKFVLWAVAIGLLGLALWRLSETVVGTHPTQQQEDDRKPQKRAKAAVLAVVYLSLAWSAVQFAMGSGKSSGQQNAGLSAKLMQSGWGKAVLVVAGLVVLGVGAYHVYKGVKKKFLKDLKKDHTQTITRLGMAGYIAKGTVLGGAGLLVIFATLTSDPAKASGIDAAVKTLGQAPFGKVLLVLAAAGLAAYGLFSFALAKSARL